MPVAIPGGEKLCDGLGALELLGARVEHAGLGKELGHVLPEPVLRVLRIRVLKVLDVPDGLGALHVARETVQGGRRRGGETGCDRCAGQPQCETFHASPPIWHG